MDDQNIDRLDLQNKRDYLYALVLAVYRVTDKFPPEEALRLRMREEAVNILSHVEHIYAGRETDRYNKFVNSIQTLVHYCEVASEQRWMHEQNFDVLKHELFKLRNSFEMPQEMEPLQEGTEDAPYEVDLSKKKDPEPSLDNEQAPDEPFDSHATDLRKVSTIPLYEGIYPGVVEEEETAPNIQLADLSSGASAEGGAPVATEQTDLPAGEAGAALEIPEKKNNFVQTEEKEGFIPPASEGSGRGLTERQNSIIIYLREAGSAQVQDLSNILPDVSARTIRRDLDALIKKGKVTKHGKTNGAKYKMA